MLEINYYLKTPITSLQFHPSDDVMAFPMQLFDNIDHLWDSGVENFEWWHGILDYWESVLFPMISELDGMMRNDNNVFLQVLQHLSKIDFFKISGDFYTSDIYNLLLNLNQSYSSIIIDSIEGITPQQAKQLQDALLEKTSENEVSFRKILIKTKYESIIEACRVLLRIGIWQECIKYSIKNSNKNALIKFFSIVTRLQNMFINEFTEHKRNNDGIAYYYCLALYKTKHNYYRDEFCSLFGTLGEFCHSIILCYYLTEHYNWPNDVIIKIKKLLCSTSTAERNFEVTKTGYYRRDPLEQKRKEYLLNMLDDNSKELFYSIKQVLQRKEVQQNAPPRFLFDNPSIKKKRRRVSHRSFPWDTVFPNNSVIEDIPPIEELVASLPTKDLLFGVTEKNLEIVSIKHVERDSSPTTITETAASKQDMCPTKEHNSPSWQLPKDFFDYSYIDPSCQEDEFIPGFLENIIDYSQINIVLEDGETANEILSAAFSEMINSIAEQEFIDNTIDNKFNLAHALTGRKVDAAINNVEWKNPKGKGWYHINAISYLTQKLHGGKYDFIGKVFLNIEGCDAGAYRADNVKRNTIKPIIEKFLGTINNKLKRICLNEEDEKEYTQK